MGDLSDFDTSKVNEVCLHWGIRVPMRDGVSLAGTLYVPRHQPTPTPAIFTLTPYISQTYHEFALDFAAHGYPFLAVDVRGRGNSEGVFSPFASSANDGYDIVEWLAKQAYCDGHVAMWGGSYAGHGQWSAAAKRPPHLRTIVPVASSYLGVDHPARNNIFPPYVMQWLTLISGKTSQDRIFWNNERFWGAQFRAWFESGTAFNELDRFLGNCSPTFQEWMRHPHQDAYWDSHNPTAEEYAAVSIPVLTITGIYDADQLGALTHYREHLSRCASAARSMHHLVIGPWDHAGTRTPKLEFAGLKVGRESLLDMQSLHRAWYAWTMQGGTKPAFLKNRVAYYLMGSDRWCYADSLEAVTTESVTLYLHSRDNPTDVFASGALANVPSVSGPDQYVYDPRDASLADLESSVDPESRSDHRMVYACIGKQLVYHTLPFDKDTDVCGFFRLTLWVSIDQPDTDLRASVFDVGIDGSAIQLTADWMRARYREGLRAEILIETAAPLRYDFQRFMFVARRIPRGHRLRLVIGPINSIYSQKNHNSGGAVAEETIKDARPVTVKLFHDQSHPSALYMPLGRQQLERRE